MKKLFISILNFNSNKETMRCLESLAKVTHRDLELEIVVIDNASTIPFKIGKNMTSDIKLKVIRKEENTGFSGGHNIAIRYALENGADYVMILNNDVEVDRLLIEKLYEPFT